MAQTARNVKSKFRGFQDKLDEWLANHPRTLAYLVVLLTINYILDFLPPIF